MNKNPSEPHGRLRLHLIGISSLLMFLLLAPGGALQAQQRQRVVYLGMILGAGGLGDRSFNDSAYEGLRDAQKKYGIRFEIAHYTSDQANRDALRGFARAGYDLIIGIGFENQVSLQTVAAEYPGIAFAIVDVVAEGSNIASIVYREQEGDFLMGVLAAMLTKSKVVGMLGGMDIPVIRRIESGFRQGAAFQDSGVTVLSDMAGSFSDAELGKELALKQYARGADVIYNAAGRTGLGVIEAAKQAGKLTIGTSGDQRYLAPGHVAGNRPKRVDTAVLTLVEEIRQGRFKTGIRSFGLKEQGLTLGPFDPDLVSPKMLERLDDLKKRIIRGEIIVEP